MALKRSSINVHAAGESCSVCTICTVKTRCAVGAVGATCAINGTFPIVPSRTVQRRNWLIIHDTCAAVAPFTAFASFSADTAFSAGTAKPAGSAGTASPAFAAKYGDVIGTDDEDIGDRSIVNCNPAISTRTTIAPVPAVTAIAGVTCLTAIPAIAPIATLST